MACEFWMQPPKSYQINTTNLILLRTILTNVAYNLPVIGQFIILTDFIMMVIDKQRRSL